MPVSDAVTGATRALWACKKWNARYPVGKWVRVLRADGSKLITKTTGEAFVYQAGQVAMIKVEGEAFHSLDRVTALDTVKAVADA